jgi:hypothetical protein
MNYFKLSYTLLSLSFVSTCLFGDLESAIHALWAQGATDVKVVGTFID